MRTNRRTRLVGALTALSLVAVLGACASDGGGAATTVPPSPPLTATTTAPSTPAGADATSVPSTPAGADATTTVPADGTGGVTPIPGGALQDELADLPTSTLTEAERAGLLWMREEEKLALDVYRALGAAWGVRIFDNIAAAEETHMAAVATLLDRYGLPDPAAANEPGRFTDPALQALYDDLVAQGRTSLTEALRVGAAIEELDIADLRARATTTADIALVYANLEKGSRNHLRAFVAQLAGRGETYTPVHITAAAFAAIVDAAMERGIDG